MTAIPPRFQELLRRLGILAVLLGLMAGLRALALDAPLGGTDPRTLAAVGFVLLAAFTVGELGGLLGLPRVTGYIIAGVALGPFGVDLLSTRVASELRVFNTLALGLIATSAGLELDVRAVARQWRTLAATVLLKVLLLLLLVGGGLLLLLPWVPGVPDGAGPALALVVAVLGIGTSPAIVVAVINERRARGRMPELILGMAVVKDVVVVLALAVAIAVARASTSGADFDPAVIGHLVKELASSIAAGAVVGGLIIAYVRFIGREMLVFVAAMVLVVAEISLSIHLELLLVFIVAGLVVRNLSSYEHRVLAPLETVALPVFVVFFSTAGANLDIPGIIAVLPVGLALFALRAGAYAVAGRLGARFGGEVADVQRRVFLGYLPQAGVTLGLVYLAVGALPDLAAPLQQVALSVVALNLLVGPITLGMALKPGRADADEAAAEAPPSTPPAPVVMGVELPPALAVEFNGLGYQLHEAREAFCATQLDAWIDEQGRRLLPLAAADRPPAERRQELRRLLDTPVGATDRGRVVAGLLQTWRQALLELSPLAVVALEDAQRHGQPGDSLRQRGRRLLARLRRQSTRRVPTRITARIHLEPVLAEAALRLARSWHRAEAAVLDEARAAVEGSRPPRLEPRLEALRRDMAALEVAIERGLLGLADLLARLGGPEGPARPLRFSAVSLTIEAGVRQVEAEAGEWGRVLAASRDTVVFADVLARIRHRTLGVVERRLFAPLGRVQRTMAGLLGSVRERLDKAQATLDGDDVAALERVASRLWARADHLRLRQATSRAQAGSSLAPLSVDLRRLVQEAPERLTVVADATPAWTAALPGQVDRRAVPLRTLLERHLLEELLSDPAVAGQALRDFVTELDERIVETLNRAAFALEQAAEGTPATHEEARQATTRAAQEIEALEERLTRQVALARERMIAALEQAVARIESAARATPVLLVGRAGSRRLWRGVRRQAEEGWRRVRSSMQRGRQRIGATSDQIVHDIRVRSGRENLDATRMGAYVRALAPPVGALPLPGPCQRVLSLGPLEDRRLFVLRTAELARLVEAEQGFLRGERRACLVAGPRGSGRSSLLNMLVLELSVERVLKPDLLNVAWRGGLVPALAAELDCQPERAAVLRALRSRRTAVLLDDLEHAFAPTLTGRVDMEEAFEIIHESSDRVFWVAAMNADALRVLEEVVPVRHLFSDEVPLRPVDAADLEALLGTRLRLVGHELVPPAGRMKLTRDLQLRRWQAALGRLAEGNLAAGLVLARTALRAEGERGVTPTALAPLDLPFAGQLAPEAIALLATLVRFGPMEVGLLARILARPAGRVQADLLHLAVTGLAGFEGTAGLFGVPPEVVPLVVAGLRARGIDEEALA